MFRISYTVAYNAYLGFHKGGNPPLLPPPSYLPPPFPPPTHLPSLPSFPGGLLPLRRRGGLGREGRGLTQDPPPPPPKYATEVMNNLLQSLLILGHIKNTPRYSRKVTY